MEFLREDVFYSMHRFLKLQRRAFQKTFAHCPVCKCGAESFGIEKHDFWIWEISGFWPSRIFGVLAWFFKVSITYFCSCFTYPTKGSRSQLARIGTVDFHDRETRWLYWFIHWIFAQFFSTPPPPSPNIDGSPAAVDLIIIDQNNRFDHLCCSKWFCFVLFWIQFRKVLVWFFVSRILSFYPTAIIYVCTYVTSFLHLIIDHLVTVHLPGCFRVVIFLNTVIFSFGIFRKSKLDDSSVLVWRGAFNLELADASFLIICTSILRCIGLSKIQKNYILVCCTAWTLVVFNIYAQRHFVYST